MIQLLEIVQIPPGDMQYGFFHFSTGGPRQKRSRSRANAQCSHFAAHSGGRDAHRRLSPEVGSVSAPPYAPRSLKSRLIDDGTGGYGYSHVSIDCGEVDQPTGKHVMTESTTGDVVHRSFQDHYGSRPFARILLSHLDLDAGKFRDCVNEKLGESYDVKEALTWGAVDDPAKQICSDLAGDCLPDEARKDIARERLARRLRRLSVSVHRQFRRKTRVFISPNGLAEYFGAPHGSRLSEPDYLVTPKRPPDAKRIGGKMLGKAAAIILSLACCVFVAWLLTERMKAEAGRMKEAG